MTVKFLKDIVASYTWFEAELQHLRDAIDSGTLDHDQLHNHIGRRDECSKVLSIFSKAEEYAYDELKLRGEVE